MAATGHRPCRLVQRYAEEAEGLGVLPNVAAAVEWTDDYIESVVQA